MVDIVNPGQGRIAYKATSELAPGRWPTLDKACRIILEDESPITPPTDADRARTDGDERAWFKG